jgi:hypothetical protein
MQCSKPEGDPFPWNPRRGLAISETLLATADEVIQ